MALHKICFSPFIFIKRPCKLPLSRTRTYQNTSHHSPFLFARWLILKIFYNNDIPWLHALYVTVIEKNDYVYAMICGKRLCTVIAVIVHKFLIRLAFTHFFKYIMSTTSIMAGVAVLEFRERGKMFTRCEKRKIMMIGCIAKLVFWIRRLKPSNIVF